MMRFRLIMKESIRDFKNKLQLFVSFTLFLIVCISLIIGMLSFSHTFSGFYNSVLNGSIQTPNARMSQFYFLDKNAEKHEDAYNLNAQNYELDKKGKFEKFIFYLLQNTGTDENGNQLKIDDSIDKNFGFDSNNQQFYSWGEEFSSDQIKTLEDMIDTNYSSNNIISYIGMNRGLVDYQSIQNFVSKNDTLIDKDIRDGLMKDPTTNAFYNTMQSLEKMPDKSLSQYQSSLEFLALIKLNRIANAPLPSTRDYYSNYFKDINLWQYDSNLMNKYIIQNKLMPLHVKGELNFGMNETAGSPWFRYNSKSEVTYTLMPGEKWMDDYSNKSPTPDQFKSNEIQNIIISHQLSPDEIGEEYLKSMHYVYLDPAFLHGNDIKVGQVISWDDKGTIRQAKVIGEALSQEGYYNRQDEGFIYMPIQFMNEIRSASATKSEQDEQNQKEPSYAYQENYITTNYSIHVTGLGDDYSNANDYMMNNVYKDFTLMNSNSDYISLSGKTYSITNPISLWFLPQAKASQFLFLILSICISLGVAVLLVVVFWFIARESVKMQRNTLWFLKALGEKKRVLALLTTINIMIPFLIGSVVAIFGSLGVNSIMASAVSNAYAFYMPVWSFTWFSLVVLLIMIAIAFVIFLGINVAILSGKSLTIHGDSKIGIITKLFMLTKPMYKNAPTSFNIGMSFVIQNIFKNILTFILLLLAFGIVLFSMQFNSSAQYSAHSFEKRNSPYQSLMLNKMNNTDAISLNNTFLKQNFNITNGDIQKYLGQDTLNDILSAFYSTGYESKVINSYKDDEQQIQNSIPELKPIDDNPSFHEAIYSPFVDLYNFSNSNNKNIYELLNKLNADSFSNRFLSENYVNGTLLNTNCDTKTLADHILSISDEDIGKGVDLFKNNAQLIGQFLYTQGIVSHEAEQKIIKGIQNINRDDAIKAVGNVMNYAINYFSTYLTNIRGTVDTVDSNLSNYGKLNLSIFFNKSIIPTDTSSVMSINMAYKGNTVNAYALDSRDDYIYKKIVDPYGFIPTIKSDKDFDSSENMGTVSETNNTTNIKKDVKVHLIHGDVSGNFADSRNLHENEIIKLVAPGMTNGYKQSPIVYMKIDKIVSQASVFQEIYFNKIDYFNYIKQSILHNWNQNPVMNPSSNQTPQTTYGNKVELDYIDKILSQIKSNDTNAKYVLNNSVFSYDKIPYSLNKLTIDSKIGQGITFFSFIPLPMFDYESDNYSSNINNSVYIFSVVTQKLMRQVQPVSSTLVRFITLLLILTFVVALILINLVLLENRQTILLFKAMGYKLRQINLYLLSGYIFADLFGLMAGILIAYYGIKVASKMAVNMIHVSLFPVWSWQFIITAVAMAIIFMILIFVAVTWYTAKQKPRDAFNTL